MNLIIAEKPSVAANISKVMGATNKKDGYFEGNDYLVTWCIGHLVGLANAEHYNKSYAKWTYNDLPIIPTDWVFHISKGKEKQMKIIETLMNKIEVDTIICATDAGREGELIFRLVYDTIGCTKPIKRLWISSMEEEAIAKGFSELSDGKDFENLYQAALCRAKADWIVGINTTRLFSILYNQTLNIGRVMTPTLAMIVKRDTAISGFIPEPFYHVSLTCDEFSLLGERLKEKEQATLIAQTCNEQTINIKNVERKEKTANPPKLYDLTTLQREANKLLGFTAEQTLSYVQSLYEKKLCTYPRTDSRYVTEDMNHTVLDVITAISKFLALDSNHLPNNVAQVTNNNKVSDHHAIIPTIKVNGLQLDSLPFGERETLRLISIRLLVATHKAHTYAETTITASYGDFVFSTKGKTILEEGFKEIQKHYKDTDIKEEKPLPILAIGDTFIVHASIKEGKTTPPEKFTDNTLLSFMENANNAVDDTDRKGIGTPATRAGIMEKLIKAGLVERKGNSNKNATKAKYFVPTHKGISLITVLPESVQSPYLTAEWESKLKMIEDGELSPEIFLEEITNMITSLVKTYQIIKEDPNLINEQQSLFPSEKESIGICPRCNSDVNENKKGFCCSNKSCNFALWKNNRFFTTMKKNITKAIAIELIQNGKVALKGCNSEKTGNTYDCTILLDDTGGKYVEFKMNFNQKGDK